MYIWNCDITTIIKIMNVPIIPQSFLLPLLISCHHARVMIILQYTNTSNHLVYTLHLHNSAWIISQQILFSYIYFTAAYLFSLLILWRPVWDETHRFHSLSCRIVFQHMTVTHFIFPFSIDGHLHHFLFSPLQAIGIKLLCLNYEIRSSL